MNGQRAEVAGVFGPVRSLDHAAAASLFGEAVAQRALAQGPRPVVLVFTSGSPDCITDVGTSSVTSRPGGVPATVL